MNRELKELHEINEQLHSMIEQQANTIEELVTENEVLKYDLQDMRTSLTRAVVILEEVL